MKNGTTFILIVLGIIVGLLVGYIANGATARRLHACVQVCEAEGKDDRCIGICQGNCIAACLDD